ncbi:MAG: DUF615 domain-containing protein [Deltaproteobacteria bacterium]|nr:DUF615 domain-containing protein [Deltaproteobacteria bacterium]
MPINDDEGQSRRQLAKKAQKTAGDRSAKLARELMKVPKTTLDRLGLADDVRAVIDRARGVTAQVARRREERGVAGVLRAIDLRALARRLASVQATGAAEPRQFQRAEAWRTQLIVDGELAAVSFVKAHPSTTVPELMLLIAKARSERDTGKPPGAARALFRHVVAAMEATAAGATAGAAPVGDDEDAVEDDALDDDE